MRADTASARPQLALVHELEGAVEHGLNLDVVRTKRVIGPFLRPSVSGPQMAREKQLRPDHPTLVDGNIGGFPHHVRKWGDSEHNILRNKLKSWISMS